MSDALLALWVMLIGADRIDLVGGGASFVLTPYLALTPLVILAELLRRWRTGQPVRVPPSGLFYTLFAGALVTVVLVSTVNALDVRISAARALLLTAQVAGTLTVALLCRGRPNLALILARGAAVCLLVFIAFDFAEALWWIGRAPETLRVGPVLLHFGALQNVGPIPRLAGPVSDANRGGFVLLFFGLLISAGETRPILRRFGLTLVVLLLAATISRSAWLGAFAMGVALMIRQRGRIPPMALATGSLAVAAVACLYLMNPRFVTRTVSLVTTPAAERLTAGEGSAQSHLALIERGVDDATESIPVALMGFGYGNSHLVLQDVFPGNKYGNFHSLYVSMFAESGVLALVLTLVLMLTPFIAGGPWRPLIAAALVFNVFYQTPTEPAFWFMLAVAWLTIPARPRSRGADETWPARLRHWRV